eukprot:1361856-Amphidinium_carterae.1
MWGGIVSVSAEESARSSESKQESQRRHYSSSPNASQRAPQSATHTPMNSADPPILLLSLG